MVGREEWQFGRREIRSDFLNKTESLWISLRDDSKTVSVGVVLGVARVGAA